MSINIGKLIKDARESNNLTQEQLALKVGKKRSYISRVETDYANKIKLQTLIEILDKGFGIEIEIKLNNK